MKVAILQPSYIPWRGLFHQIQKVDTFIFYDDVQFDKHGWRNRNRIKFPGGPKWLTIPVRSKGNVEEGIPINRIEPIWDKNWASAHRQTLEQAYRKAPFWKSYVPLLDDFYSRKPTLLADFTIDFTIALARELGLGDRRFLRSSSLPSSGVKTERLLSLLQPLGCTHYVSGPSARDYLDEEKIAAAGMTLEYMTYDYPEYEQLYPPWDPQVSVLDLLFMTGPAAPKYIWPDPCPA